MSKIKFAKFIHLVVLITKKREEISTWPVITRLLFSNITVQTETVGFIVSLS